MDDKSGKYFLPQPSKWPIIASIGLFTFLMGIAHWVHNVWFGPYIILTGFLILVYVIHGWFGDVIHENRLGLTQTRHVDHSFRFGMLWFIFSEVMFFASFFGALFYVRIFIMPDLGDATSITHIILWPNFQESWPLLQNPSMRDFIAPESGMPAWGIAAINTLVLFTSGITVTIAHIALLNDKRKLMLVSQLATIALGITFLFLQANEYYDAYVDKGLTLSSGIYGSTFFMLTGFHGLHVTIGTIGLCTIFYRMLKRDFNPHNHFAFEAISWYWHFVDVVWILLFIFVYWL